MFVNNIRYSILFKAISIALVCLFLVNDISWAQPAVYNNPAKINTLAVQSIFNPIINAVGIQHQKQVELELNGIIAMALRGLKRDSGNPSAYISFLNMNSALDKRCANLRHIYEKFVERTLEVVDKPKILDDDPEKPILIRIKTTGSPENQKHFNIIFRGDKLADMLDSSKVKVAEEKIATSAAQTIDPVGIEEAAIEIVKNNFERHKKDAGYFDATDGGWQHIAVQTAKDIGEKHNKFTFIELEEIFSKFHENIELRQFFWMVREELEENYSAYSNKGKPLKVVLALANNPRDTEKVNDALGIQALKGVLKKRFKNAVDVTLIHPQITKSEDEITKNIKDIQPDILGISLDFYGWDKMMRLASVAQELKAKPILVIGNVGAAFAYKQILEKNPQALICTGEGEDTISYIVSRALGENVELKNIPNLAYNEQGNIVSRPVEIRYTGRASRDFLDKTAETLGMSLSEFSRGCKHNCSFCSRAAFLGRGNRSRKVQDVLEEVVEISRAGIGFINFVDDDFSQIDLNTIWEFADGLGQLKEKGIIPPETRFATSVTAQGVVAFDDSRRNGLSLLKKLADVGLKTLYVGVESGSKEQMTGRYHKSATIDINIKALEAMKREGIFCVAGFIMFDPLVLLREVKQNIDFCRKNGIDGTMVYACKTLLVMLGTQLPNFYKDQIRGEPNYNALSYEYVYDGPDADDIANILYILKQWEESHSCAYWESKTLKRSGKYDTLTLDEKEEILKSMVTLEVLLMDYLEELVNAAIEHKKEKDVKEIEKKFSKHTIDLFLNIVAKLKQKQIRLDNEKFVGMLNKGIVREAIRVFLNGGQYFSTDDINNFLKREFAKNVDAISVDEIGSILAGMDEDGKLIKTQNSYKTTGKFYYLQDIPYVDLPRPSKSQYEKICTALGKKVLQEEDIRRIKEIRDLAGIGMWSVGNAEETVQELENLQHDVGNSMFGIIGSFDFHERHNYVTPQLREIYEFCNKINDLMGEVIYLRNKPQGLEDFLKRLRVFTEEAQTLLDYRNLEVIFDEVYARFVDRDKVQKLKEAVVDAPLSGLILTKNTLADFFPDLRKEPKLTNITALIDSTLGCITSQRVKRKEYLTGNIELVVDEVALSRALVNIVINAKEAILVSNNGKGDLSLKTSIVDDGKFLEISVSDTAGGIPPGILPHIFDRGFSTRNVKGGRARGTGLAIAKKYIEDRCGGTISVESEPGKGTTFTLRLPVVSTESSGQATRLPITPPSAPAPSPAEAELAVAQPSTIPDHILQNISEEVVLKSMAMNFLDHLRTAGYEQPQIYGSGSLINAKIIDIDTSWLPYPNGATVGILPSSAPGLDSAIMLSAKGSIKETNFILISPIKPVYFGKNNPNVIFTNFAVFINKDGQLVLGRFKEPIPVHALTHSALQTKGTRENICKRGVPLLNSPASLVFSNSKIATTACLKESGLLVPKSHVLEGRLTGQEIESAIKYFFESYKPPYGIVVKPDDQSQGKNVQMFTVEHIDEAVRHTAMLLEQGIKVILSERIANHIWVDGATRQTIDWNLRVLSTWDGNEPVIDPEMIEVRYKPMDDNPVNKSRGADVILLSSFFEKLKMEPELQKRFLASIIETVKRAAIAIEAKTSSLTDTASNGIAKQNGLVGWDLIMSDDGRWYFIESNAGNVGGIGTIEGLLPKEDKGKAVLSTARYLASLANRYKEIYPDARTDKPGESIDVLGDPDIVAALAGWFIGTRDFAEAEKVLRLALEINPSHSNHTKILALILSEQGKFIQAEEMYHRALELDPYNHSARSWLAQLLDRQKRSEEAKSQLRRILDINPNHMEALALLGMLLFNEKQYGEAKVFIDRALVFDPRQPLLLSHRLEIAVEENNAEDITLYTSRCIDIIKEYTGRHLTFFKQVLAFVENALGRAIKNIQDSELYLKLGNTYFEAGIMTEKTHAAFVELVKTSKFNEAHEMLFRNRSESSSVDTVPNPGPKTPSPAVYFSQTPEKLIEELQEERTLVHSLHASLKPAVTIFGSARIPDTDPMYAKAQLLGEAIYRMGAAICTGAGPSMMEAPLKGYIKARNESGKQRSSENATRGRRIRLPFEQKTNSYVEDNHEFNHFVTRKSALYENSLGIIALPGGFGTIDELLEVWFRKQPLVLIGVEYWKPIIEAFFASWGKESFSEEAYEYPLITDSIEDALAYIQKRSLDKIPYVEETPDKANDELRDNLTKLSQWSPSVTFIGEPKENSRQLDIARQLSSQLISNNIPVRAASRGALLKAMSESAVGLNNAGLLQATIFALEKERETGEGAGLEKCIVSRHISNHHVMTAENSKAFVFLPGGIETMNRLFDIIAITQTGKFPYRPIILVGREFWQPIKDAITKSALSYSPSLIRRRDANLLQVVDTAEEALVILGHSRAQSARLGPYTILSRSSFVLNPDISHDIQKRNIQESVERIAYQNGLEEEGCSRLIDLAYELASNMLKFGNGGYIDIVKIREESGRIGIGLIGQDSGSGIEDPELLRIQSNWSVPSTGWGFWIFSRKADTAVIESLNKRWEKDEWNEFKNVGESDVKAGSKISLIVFNNNKKAPAGPGSQEMAKALIYNPWMEHLLGRRGEALKERDGRLFEEFLTRDHPLKENIFSQVDKLSDDDILKRADECLAADGLKRPLTFRELFIRPTMGETDLDQILLSTLLSCARKNDIDNKIQTGREPEVRANLEFHYIIIKAMEILSRKKDLALIKTEDLDELVHAILGYKVSSQALLNLLSLSDLCVYLDTPQKQESLNNLLIVIDRVLKENQRWVKIVARDECRRKIEEIRGTLKSLGTIAQIESRIFIGIRCEYSIDPSLDYVERKDAFAEQVKSDQLYALFKSYLGKIPGKIGSFSSMHYAYDQILSNAFDTIVDQSDSGHDKNYRGRIVSEFYIDGNDMVLAVTDNGKTVKLDDEGMPLQRMRNTHKHIGGGGGGNLIILSIICKNFGGNVKWYPLKEGTRFEARIPVKNIPDALRGYESSSIVLEGMDASPSTGIASSPAVPATSPGSPIQEPATEDSAKRYLKERFNIEIDSGEGNRDENSGPAAFLQFNLEELKILIKTLSDISAIGIDVSGVSFIRMRESHDRPESLVSSWRSGKIEIHDNFFKILLPQFRNMEEQHLHVLVHEICHIEERTLAVRQYKEITPKDESPDEIDSDQKNRIFNKTLRGEWFSVGSWQALATTKEESLEIGIIRALFDFLYFPARLTKFGNGFVSPKAEENIFEDIADSLTFFLLYREEFRRRALAENANGNTTLFKKYNIILETIKHGDLRRLKNIQITMPAEVENISNNAQELIDLLDVDQSEALRRLRELSESEMQAVCLAAVKILTKAVDDNMRLETEYTPVSNFVPSGSGKYDVMGLKNLLLNLRPVHHPPFVDDRWPDVKRQEDYRNIMRLLANRGAQDYMLRLKIVWFLTLPQDPVIIQPASGLDYAPAYLFPYVGLTLQEFNGYTARGEFPKELLNDAITGITDSRLRDNLSKNCHFYTGINCLDINDMLTSIDNDPASKGRQRIFLLKLFEHWIEIYMKLGDKPIPSDLIEKWAKEMDSALVREGDLIVATRRDTFAINAFRALGYEVIDYPAGIQEELIQSEGWGQLPPTEVTDLLMNAFRKENIMWPITFVILRKPHKEKTPLKQEERNIISSIFKVLGVDTEKLNWRNVEGALKIAEVPVEDLNEYGLKTAFDLLENKKPEGKIVIVSYKDVPMYIFIKNGAYAVNYIDLSEYYYSVDKIELKEMRDAATRILIKNDVISLVTSQLDPAYPYIRLEFDHKTNELSVYPTLKSTGETGPSEPGLARFSSTSSRAVLKTPVLPGVFNGVSTATVLCAKATAENVKPGMKVLVIGSGTGVETWIAATKGASHVDAVDIKDMAVENTRLTCALAGITEKVNVFKNDMFDGLGKYDLVIFNMPHIFPEVPSSPITDITPSDHNTTDTDRSILQRYAKGILSHLNPGGKAIFINTAAPIVRETIEKETHLTVLPKALSNEEAESHLFASRVYIISNPETAAQARSPEPAEPFDKSSGFGPEQSRRTEGPAGRAGAKETVRGSIKKLTGYIKSTTNKRIVNIGITSPEQIIESLIRGEVVAVSFRKLKSVYRRYEVVNSALYLICKYVHMEYPPSMYIGGADFFYAVEVFKNAFVHGNKLNFEYPIFLNLKEINGLYILETFDVASTEKASNKEMKKAKLAGLYSSGKAERDWLSCTSYKRQIIKSMNDKIIGTVASLVLNPRGRKNTLEGEPDVLITPTVSTPGVAMPPAAQAAGRVSREPSEKYNQVPSPCPGKLVPETAQTPAGNVGYFKTELLKWVKLKDNEREKFHIQPVWDNDTAMLGKINNRGELVTLTPEVGVALDANRMRDYPTLNSIVSEVVRNKAGINRNSEEWKWVYENLFVHPSIDKINRLKGNDTMLDRIVAISRIYCETALPMMHHGDVYIESLTGDMQSSDLFAHIFCISSINMLFQVLGNEYKEENNNLRNEFKATQFRGIAFGRLKYRNANLALEVYRRVFEFRPDWALRIASDLAGYLIQEPSRGQDICSVAYELRDKDVWDEFIKIIKSRGGTISVESPSTSFGTGELGKGLPAEANLDTTHAQAKAGTTFTLRLPMVSSKSSGQAIRSPIAPSSAAQVTAGPAEEAAPMSYEPRAMSSKPPVAQAAGPAGVKDAASKHFENPTESDALKHIQDLVKLSIPPMRKMEQILERLNRSRANITIDDLDLVNSAYDELKSSTDEFCMGLEMTYGPWGYLVSHEIISSHMAYVHIGILNIKESLMNKSNFDNLLDDVMNDFRISTKRAGMLLAMNRYVESIENGLRQIDFDKCVGDIPLFTPSLATPTPIKTVKYDENIINDPSISYSLERRRWEITNDEQRMTSSELAMRKQTIRPEDIVISNEVILLRRASKCLGSYAVDEVIDLSLIPKKDLEANMKTWAYIIALNNKHGLDVNYVFRSRDKAYNAAAKKMLFKKLEDMKMEEMKARVIDLSRPEALKVHIMKKEELEKLKRIPRNILPVAMSEGETLDGTPLRDFVSASAIGLAQAACKKMKQEKDPRLLEVIAQEILPRMQNIYQRLFPGQNIKEIVTKETVLNMIDDNSLVRKNLAIALALPPIIRAAIEYLKAYHDNLHSLLQSA